MRQSNQSVQSTEAERLWTIEEVAARVRLRPKTIRKYTMELLSGWPQPRRVGKQRKWLWEATQVEAWISRQPMRALKKEARS